MNNPAENYVLVGRNNRFTEIAAAMGLSQLRCLPEFLERRRRVAAVYDEMLLKSELFVPLLAENGSVPSYWRYVATPTVQIDRVALRDRLAAGPDHNRLGLRSAASLSTCISEHDGYKTGNVTRFRRHHVASYLFARARTHARRRCGVCCRTPASPRQFDGIAIT